MGSFSMQVMKLSFFTLISGVLSSIICTAGGRGEFASYAEPDKDEAELAKGAEKKAMKLNGDDDDGSDNDDGTGTSGDEAEADKADKDNGGKKGKKVAFAPGK